MQWNCNEDIITDAQSGFQTGRSITDAIFALHSLISEKLIRIRDFIVNLSTTKIV